MTRYRICLLLLALAMVVALLGCTARPTPDLHYYPTYYAKDTPAPMVTAVITPEGPTVNVPTPTPYAPNWKYVPIYQVPKLGAKPFNPSPPMAPVPHLPSPSLPYQPSLPRIPQTYELPRTYTWVPSPGISSGGITHYQAIPNPPRIVTVW